MKTISIPALPEVESRSPTGKYHSFAKDISVALGGIRDVGTWGGGHPFDLQQRRVPAGARVCPLHAHTAQWELFIVLAGTATIRLGDGTQHTVNAGDTFVQPPGTAHQIINPGPADFIFYVIADHHAVDSTYYPDSAKWQMKPQHLLFRPTETTYFDGEE
jgi:uncharacterized cupin superfamily protein